MTPNPYFSEMASRKTDIHPSFPFWKTLLIFFGILTFGLTSFGQSGKYLFHRYTSTDGLPSSKVNQAIQDSRGFLWIATDAGVSCFDGHSFKNYSFQEGLPTSFVECLAANPVDSSVWVGTNKGLVRIAGDSLTVFGLDHGLPSPRVKNLLVTSSGEVWVATYAGLCLLKEDNFRIFTTEDGLNHNAIYSLLELRDGTLLIGNKKGINAWNGENITPWWSPDSEVVVMDMLQDEEGVIWATTLHNQLMRGSQQHFVPQSYPGQDSVFLSSYLSLGPDGKLYLLHLNSISVFKDGSFHHTIDHIYPKGANTLTGIQADKEGNIWLSTVKGLIRGREAHTEFYSCIDKPCGTDVESILVNDQGEIFVGGIDGSVRRLTPGGLEVAFPEKPHQVGEIYGMVQDRNRHYWFASNLGGIVRYDGQEYTHWTRENGLPRGLILSMKEFKDGSIWAGMTNKMIEWNGSEWVVHQLDKYKKMNALSIAQGPDGAIWIGSSSGLHRFVDGDYNDYSTSTGTEGLVIKKLLWKSDSLWITTKGKGIMCFKLTKDNELVKMGHWSGEDGLESDFIHDMVIDRKGQIWASSMKGLISIKIGEANEPDLISHYDETDGIVDDAWKHAPITTDHQGNLLLGTGKGLTRINLSQFGKASRAPSVFLTGIKLFEKEVNWRADQPTNSLGLPQNLDLDHDQNHLTFYYTGINLKNPGRVRYRHRMLGLDSNWSALTELREASFPALPPGSYTFEVEAISGDGLFSPSRVSLPVIIAPPYYETWWFRTLTGLFILLALLTAYRIRTRQIIRREQAKMQMEQELNESRQIAFRAQTNPHFIFNSLSSVQHFIAENDRTSALTYLSKFSRLLRRVLEHSRNTYVTLSEELELIRTYIEIEQLRFSERFDYSIDVDDNLDPNQIQLPGMLLQPVVENAIRHGLLLKEGKGMLKVEVKMRKSGLKISVVDNGIGRAASKAIQAQRTESHQAFGTQVTRDMLNTLDLNSGSASIRITDLFHANGQAAGTRVDLEIPIKVEN